MHNPQHNINELCRNGIEPTHPYQVMKRHRETGGICISHGFYQQTCKLREDGSGDYDLIHKTTVEMGNCYGCDDEYDMVTDPLIK